jgi:hypothetical protein
MQNERFASEARLNEIARARLGFVLVMLAMSICSLVIDLWFV